MRHHNLQVTGSVVVNGLGVATTSELTAYTASADAKISTLQAFTSSVGTTNTFTASASGRLNSIETISASNIGRLNSLEAKTGSLATTGSNTFIGTQTITGSLYISSDLIVQGSSSLQNITASAVSIGTNLINLNTANPAIRYAGLVIGDSGSVGGSGSFLYDSVQDEMLFVHRGSSTVVTSSVALMGPETYDNLGNETYPTLNIIQKGNGNEHLVDSCIFDNGTTTCIKNNFVSTGTGIFCGQLNAITGVFGSKGGGNYGVLISDNDQSNVRLRFTNSGTGGQSMSIVGGNPAVSNSGLAIYDETAEATRLYINSGGCIGIGLACPANMLHLIGNSATPALRIGSTSITYYWDIGRENASTGDFVFINANPTTPIERMRITTGGNVGINTCTPLNLLHIEASNNTTNQFRVNSCDGLNAGVRSYTTSDGSGLIINHYYAVSGNPYLRTSDFVSNQGDSAATQMRFFTKAPSANPALAMIITCGGYIGINTSNPQSLLDVQNCINSPYLNTNTLTSGQWLRVSNSSTCQGANSGILFVATGPGGGNGLATINGIAVACGSMSLTFATRDASSNVTEKMRILSVGTVAIGTQTSSPETSAGGPVGGLIVQGLNSCRGVIEVWDAICGKAIFQQVGGTTYIGNLYKGVSGGDLRLLVNGSGTSATEAMVITCQGRILINNNAQNSCADYSRVTISGICNKTVSGGVGGSVLHLTTCENDFPFGAKFNLNGNTCNCIRYLSIQTGDHNLFNQGNIILQQSGGNVGIGTTSPNKTGFNGTMLTVNGAGNYQGLEIASCDVARMTLLTDGAGSLGYVSTRQAGMSLIFETGAANEKMRIDSVGTIKYTGNFVNGNYYTADTTPGMCMLSAGQCINFCYMSGMLLVNDWNNGSTTLYVAGGGSTTMIGNAVSQTGCFWYNPAVVGYSWSNTSGTTRCFGFFVVRTRPNA